ncbi:MAG: GAF domain-containing protein, partial [Acidimicrobiia bacterium]|nr:GAF domain-containing protein [Acidimicrobiia bacterium]
MTERPLPDAGLFRLAPVPMWHEDMTDAVRELDALGADSEEHLRRLLSDPEVFGTVVGAIRVRDVSDRLVSTFGGTREMHLSGIDQRLATPEWLAAFIDALVGVWRGENSGNSVLAIRTWDGDRLTGLLEWFAPMLGDRPDWANAVIAFVDTSERDRLAQVVQMVAAAERVVLGATSEEEMFAEVCALAVESGYVMSWAGLADSEPPYRVRPIAVAGQLGVAAEEINVQWDDSPLGRGPTGTAVRTGEPVVIPDVAVDPAFAPWAEHAVEAGIASTLSLPLSADGLRGALVVHSDQVGAFQSEDVALLLRLAEHL